MSEKQQSMFPEHSMSITLHGLPVVRDHEGPTVRSPDEAVQFLGDVASMDREAFVVITLDARNRAINKHLVSLGLVDASLVHPREVFRPAIMDNAVSVVVAHNHPSGDTTPSAEDIQVTKRLVEAGKLIDIPVLDSLVVGTGRGPEAGKRKVHSMRDKGQVQF